MGLTNVDEFLGRFPQPKQCETKSPSGCCPDKAVYVVERVNRPTGFFCYRCVSAVIFYGTNGGKNVVVGRLENS